MTRRDQLIQQIKFGLHELTSRNGHHEFEELSRHLVRARIVSNVVPATGPVSAAGDQGRDFETFHTYLVEELGPYGGFLALASREPVAFVCSLQQDGIERKIKADVDKIAAFGRPPARVYALVTADLPVGTRHSLVDAVRNEHGIDLDVLDGAALSELLADPDVRWIGDRYLSLGDGGELDDDESGDQPDWYVSLRGQWQERGTPIPNLGDVLDISAGLRRATFHQEARPDLPFWLHLMGQIASSEDAFPLARQAARYEMVVATLRGQGDLRQVEAFVGEYLAGVQEDREPGALIDAAVLQNYCVGAFLSGATDLDAETIAGNGRALEAIANELLTAHPRGLARAQLLETLGYLRSQIDVRSDDFSDPPRGSYPDATDLVSETGEFVQPEGVQPGPELMDLLVDADGAIEAWSELASMLDEVRLFPVDSLARVLAFHTPMAATDPRWDGILDAVDRAIETVSGGAAAAELARDRAMNLLTSDNFLGAIRDLHRAKVGWWSGDNLRGSLLAMGVLAHCYSELGLYQAAKQHGLSLAFIARANGEPELGDLIAKGLFAAADADYQAGAWCSASELIEAALHYQSAFVEHGLDMEDAGVQAAIFHLTRMIEVANEFAPGLEPKLRDIADVFGFEDVVDELLDVAQESAVSTPILDAARDQGIGPPFIDAGSIRLIEFSGLGLEWRVSADNDLRTSRAAERFAAAAQILMVEFAQGDLALMPTELDVKVELATDEAPSGAEPVPSNEGRRWVVRLTPSAAGAALDPDEVNVELLAITAEILSEVSLLRTAEFRNALESAFASGLVHKMGVGRPYDDLAALVDDDRFAQTGRGDALPPVEYRPPSPNGIPWQGGPGPTFSDAKATEFLRNRYEFFLETIPITMAALSEESAFMDIVALLRAEGWLDWHLLTAVFNIVANRRLEVFSPAELADHSRRQEVTAVLFASEHEGSVVLPIGDFDLHAMKRARLGAMLSLLVHWNLECRQLTPDLPAIERFLAERYGYWSDDVPHEDPLPST